MSTKEKARIWSCICYPENMKENWEVEIDDLIQIPFAYCVHDKDLDTEYKLRKKHVHLILVFSNTTTKNFAETVANRLSEDGEICCSTSEAVIGIRSAYNYLIHDTDKCREQGKYQYPEEARVTGNNFDIGQLEQISQADKDRMVSEMAHMIIDEKIKDFAEFFIRVCENFDFTYENLIKSYSGYFERLIKGVYNRHYVTCDEKKSQKDSPREDNEGDFTDINPDESKDSPREDNEEDFTDINPAQSLGEAKVKEIGDIYPTVQKDPKDRKSPAYYGGRDKFQIYKIWYKGKYLPKSLKDIVHTYKVNGQFIICTIDFGIPISVYDCRTYLNKIDKDGLIINIGPCFDLEI